MLTSRIVPFSSRAKALTPGREDASYHSYDLFGGVSLRVFRGLNFDIFGNVARVKDQLYLSGAGLTPEERLLRVKAFATDFYYFGSFGFSYRFGSKFANVVNPRM